MTLALASPVLAVETSLSAPGASEDLQERLKGASSSLSAEAQGLDTPQEFLAAARSDYRTLVQVLYDEGFFGPEVSIRMDGREVADIPPIDVPKRVNRIDISVSTGPGFKLGQASVSPLAPDTEIPEGFRAGEPASTGVVRDAASAGVEGWRDVGHAKAKVGDQRIRADHRTSTLNADIRIAPGPRLRFGRLTVTGEEKVREEAIRDIVGFPTGEVFSPAKVQKVGTRLRRTGAFASVTIAEAETPNPDGTLNFDAVVEEQVPRRITFGGELSSRKGLDLSAIWMHRNLFGAAERFRFEARIRNLGGEEDVDGLFSFRLDRPATLGPDDNTFYVAELEQNNKPHYSTRRFSAGLGVKRVFNDDFFVEAAAIGSVSRADDAFGSDRPFDLLAFPVRAQLDKRDIRISATKGFFLEANVVPFIGFQDSASGVSNLLDGRGYLSLTQSSSIVLAGRMQLGSILGASLSETSPDLLFYSGGAGSVRGQPYESLGVPVGDSIVGGRSFLNLSAEVRGQVTDKISLVGFYDFGAIDANYIVDKNSPYHAGAGIGIRYAVGGFGPIRFDLAYPVAGPTDDGLQFYLGIGQAF